MPLAGSEGWRKSLALPCLLLALAWFATIGIRPLLEPDEGRCAEIPREMYAGGLGDAAIVPMIPALAVLLAPMVAVRAGAPKQAAWIVALLLSLAAVALVIAASRRAQVIPESLMMWSVVAAVMVIGCALRARGRWLVAAIGAVLGFQALLVAYCALPPVRTTKALVEVVRSYIEFQTELFSVNQYRQSVPPYLGRTLRMVSYRGELAFGLDQEASGFIPTLKRFVQAWRASTDAAAFIEPKAFEEVTSHGVPMHVIARDGRSGVVTRSLQDGP